MSRLKKGSNSVFISGYHSTKERRTVRDTAKKERSRFYRELMGKRVKVRKGEIKGLKFLRRDMTFIRRKLRLVIELRSY